MSNRRSKSQLHQSITSFVTNCESPSQVELVLQTSDRMKNSFALKQTVRRPIRSVSKRDVATASALSPWAVDMSCSLDADIKRIFNALTIPEYIEAWISVPGCRSDCQSVSCRVARGFQIEHHCSTGATMRISGTYFSFLKRKLSFSWRPASEVGSTDSFVDIRLYGDFGKSLLRLRHCGFASEEEFNWHVDLWAASITRLSKLFQRPGNSIDPLGPPARSLQSDLLLQV
jgi:uncharacterized protein YndB with AHSA1/START domain